MGCGECKEDPVVLNSCEVSSEVVGLRGHRGILLTWYSELAAGSESGAGFSGRIDRGITKIK